MLIHLFLLCIIDLTLYRFFLTLLLLKQPNLALVKLTALGYFNRLFFYIDFHKVVIKYQG